MRASGLLVVVPLVASGCAGFGMLQTAKALPPNETRMVVGATWAANSRPEGDDSTERSTLKFLGPQVDYRVGMVEHLDMGIGTYLFGLRFDLKYDVACPDESWGLSPRLGSGFGVTGTGSIMAPYAGVLASWSARAVGVYGGLTFINHWINNTKPSWAREGEGVTEVEGTGWGDGVVQLSAGLAFGPAWDSPMSAFLEYGLWAPAQDDPGDYFRFVTSHLFTAGLGF